MVYAIIKPRWLAYMRGIIGLKRGEVKFATCSRFFFCAIHIFMQEEVAVKSKGNMANVMKMILICVLVLAAGVGGTAFAVTKYPNVLGLSKGQAQAQAEVDMLISEVGKLIALPTDEKPTVATITDAEKLKEQLFFKNAMKDDKVLIYTKAKKAILYRPSEKKVVEVGAVNINQAPKASSTPAPVVTNPVTPVQTPEAN